MRNMLLTAAFAAFALPAQAFARDLPRKATLGIRMAPAPQGSSGVLVSQVLPGGTATAIGVRDGDLILSAGGHPVTRSNEVAAYASTLRGGDKVDLTVSRAASKCS